MRWWTRDMRTPADTLHPNFSELRIDELLRTLIYHRVMPPKLLIPPIRPFIAAVNRINKPKN